jgi:hypothetical protein
MNGSCDTPEPVLCGCCDGVSPETPQSITNRPALASVSYRVGRHAQFKASLLAALSLPENIALGPLRTRDDSDFTIALLDAWAVTADVLSFYNERIANEAYLRTAVERRSVFELARLVGYKPSPGVAASAYLAFTLSDAPGSPETTLIPAGSRVQSVPGPGQSPATFETSADLTAAKSSNAIPAQRSLPWSLSVGGASATFRGTSLNISPGDGLLFVDAKLRSSLANGVADFHYVVSAVADANSGTTTVQWDLPLASGFGTQNSGASVYIFRKKAALFGAQAPDPKPLHSSNPDFYPDPDWTFNYNPGSMQVNLDASYPGLTPQAGGEAQWAVFVSRGTVALFQITAVAETGMKAYSLAAKTTQLTLALGLVLIDMVFLATIFELIAAWETYTVALAGGSPPAVVSGALARYSTAIDAYVNVASNPVTPDQVLARIVQQTRDTTAYVRSELLPPAEPPFQGPWAPDTTYSRANGMLKPVESGNLEIAGGSQLSAGQPVAISGKRVRLQVRTGALATLVPDGATGAIAVADSQAFLVDAFPPANTAWRVTTTAGVSGTLTTVAANITLLPAAKDDPLVAETATVGSSQIAGPITTLSFTQPLSRIYDRATVTLNANVVLANQGETMHEILGSGDATNPALQFTLKQSPLTYTSSQSALGSASTLEIWVNNLQWHEVPNFLGSGPADRVFVTRVDDQQKVTVQFGDGVRGARVPSGQMNVRAVYRKGSGSGGNVQAGQLSQALDRPQGLKGVTNSGAASGGADPDTAAQARVSAPLYALTLGRAVSREDYMNFARAFAGVAKALATWTWFRATRGIFLTVAGAGGTTFQSSDATVVNLIKALAGAGLPFVPLRVQSYVPVLFELAATVWVDATDYDPSEVQARVWQALASAFSFDQRELGQGIAQSEVIAIVQGTAGVVAVELTAFQRSGDAAATPLPPALRAAGNTPPQAAEMLLLDPASQGSIVAVPIAAPGGVA